MVVNGGRVSGQGGKGGKKEGRADDRSMKDDRFFVRNGRTNLIFSAEQFAVYERKFVFTNKWLKEDRCHKNL